MIDEIHWQGDREGTLILIESAEGTAQGRRVEIDRLGDLLAAIQEGRFRQPATVGVAGGYGICLATRRVTEPWFVRQVVEQAIKHMAGSDPGSVSLYTNVQRLKKVVAESTELEGVALRDRILEEAHAFHAEVEAAR